MSRRFDEDDFRDVFRGLQPPPGVGRWRQTGSRPPVAGRGRRARRLLLAVAASSLALTLATSLVLAATRGRQPGPGPIALPPATATPRPSTAETPTAASPPATAAPTPAPRRPAWPDATTTGVPTGTRLVTHQGDLHVTRPGTVRGRVPTGR